MGAGLGVVDAEQVRGLCKRMPWWSSHNCHEVAQGHISQNTPRAQVGLTAAGPALKQWWLRCNDQCPGTLFTSGSSGEARLHHAPPGFQAVPFPPAFESVPWGPFPPVGSE